MERISFYNIETNNLKNIDFHITKYAINCVVGPSGSGKSSLVFDTVHAITQHEYNVMSGNADELSLYQVGEYKNLSLTIPLKQLNYNNNPRSTVATYYKIDRIFRSLFSERFQLDSGVFSFNKYASSCKKCKGLGYELIPDESVIIDYNSSLIDLPFLYWRGSFREYYQKLLKKISVDYEIPTDIPFKNLSEENQTFLLSGESSDKYKIAFEQNNRKRVRTQKFIGVAQEVMKQIEKGNTEAIKYSKKIICSKCSGTRYSDAVNKYKMNNKSIGELYQYSIVELKDWMITLLSEDNKFSLLLGKILVFCDKLININLDYINLNRSISSLSGGEFQRLRLSQLFNSPINDITYILDEPLSSLHVSEKKAVINEIFNLQINNTVLVIEHDDQFISRCDNITALGPSGGMYGGYIIDLKEYLLCNKVESIKKREITKEVFDIINNSNVNNVKPFNITIPKNICIGVCGVSGSGKTTFAKDILPKFLQSYKYISQKPIRGNAYSIVASYISIIEKIRELFADKNNVAKSNFSYFPSSKGSCKECRGVGKIIVEEYNYKYSYVCPVCDGKKFAIDSLKYHYRGLNIHEVLSLEIGEAVDFFEDQSYIYNSLNNANKIGLGYLKLNQSIESLSGGENQRVKLLKHINFFSKNQIITLDEPFQGLNNSEIYKTMCVIKDYCEQGNTVFIIEHNIYAIDMCEYIIEFGIGSGNNGGNIIYNGNIEDIHTNNLSIIKNYIQID